MIPCIFSTFILNLYVADILQLTQSKKSGKSSEVDQRNKSQRVVSPARAAFDEQLHEQQRRRSCTLPSKSNDTESGEHPATSSPAKKSEPESLEAPTCRALQGKQGPFLTSKPHIWRTLLELTCLQTTFRKLKTGSERGPISIFACLTATWIEKEQELL